MTRKKGSLGQLSLIVCGNLRLSEFLHSKCMQHIETWCKKKRATEDLELLSKESRELFLFRDLNVLLQNGCTVNKNKYIFINFLYSSQNTVVLFLECIWFNLLLVQGYKKEVSRTEGGLFNFIISPPVKLVSHISFTGKMQKRQRNYMIKIK